MSAHVHYWIEIATLRNEPLSMVRVYAGTELDDARALQKGMRSLYAACQTHDNGLEGTTVDLIECEETLM